MRRRPLSGQKARQRQLDPNGPRFGAVHDDAGEGDFRLRGEAGQQQSDDEERGDHGHTGCGSSEGTVACQCPAVVYAVDAVLQSFVEINRESGLVERRAKQQISPEAPCVVIPLA